MGRELKRVAPDSPWQQKDGPVLPEDHDFLPGDWYQMWQTVSDKAYTPAFATPEELARWCADHPFGVEEEYPVPFETWLRFINGPGWAPSWVVNESDGAPGVVAVTPAA